MSRKVITRKELVFKRVYSRTSWCTIFTNSYLFYYSTQVPFVKEI